MAYWVYEIICGEGVPAFMAVSCAKDKAAFAALEKRMQEMPGDEVAKVMAENSHVLTGIETMDGMYVPEASYVPEGTF